MTERDNFDDLIDDLDRPNTIKENLGFQGTPVTFVGFVRDHSGSMDDHVDPSDNSTPKKKHLAKSNFNEQIATLKKEDDGMETLLTVVEFDNEIKIKEDNLYIEEVEPLTDYWTGGMTALYDAIAFCINKIRSRMDADDRENKAALIIIETDGYENASSDYPSNKEGRAKLKKLIEELEATGRWTFTFLGAGLDEKFASAIGMAAGNTITTRAGNLGDTVYAYSVQNAGLKDFMSDRKKGVLHKSDFYKGVWNENVSDEGEYKKEN